MNSITKLENDFRDIFTPPDTSKQINSQKQTFIAQMALNNGDEEVQDEGENVEVQVSNLEDSQELEESVAHVVNNTSLVHECLPLQMPDAHKQVKQTQDSGWIVVQSDQICL